MKILKTIISYLCIFFILAALHGLTFAQEQTDSTKLEEAYNLFNKISPVQDEYNPRRSTQKLIEASNSLKKLGEYHNNVVIEFLMETIKKEFSIKASNAPNSYIVGDALVSLSNMVHKKYDDNFNDLKGLIDKNKERIDPRSFSHIESSIENLEEKIETNPQLEDKESLYFKDQLLKVSSRKLMEYVDTLFNGTNEFLTDIQRNSPERTIYRRNEEANHTIDILVRLKGKNPILIGPAGSGKTTVVEKITQMIIDKEFPDLSFYDYLRKAELLSTSPARISKIALSDSSSAQAAAIEDYFKAVLAIQEATKKPIIVFLDEVHTLSKSQVESLKPFLDSERNGIHFIGATTSKEFMAKFKDNDAIKRRFEKVAVPEFNVEEVMELLKFSWIPKIEGKYQVEFEDNEVIRRVVEESLFIVPDNGRVSASIKALMDLAIFVQRRKGENKKTVSITKQDFSDFLIKRYDLPADPRDGVRFAKYADDLKKKLNEEVLGQSHMINDIVNLWLQNIQDKERRIRVGLLLGSTGVGKTMVAKEFTQLAFPSANNPVMHIDANTYKDGSLSLNALLGAPPGVISSDKTSGELMNWLDDPARGGKGGIIIIDEAERAHKDFWEKFMEFFDTGTITGADGKIRKANNVIILLTSNRGDNVLFPKGMKNWTEREWNEHITLLKDNPSMIKNIFREKVNGLDTAQLPNLILERVDSYIIANPIDLNLALRIARKKADQIIKDTEKTFKIKLEIDDKLIEYLVKNVFNPQNGVRIVIKNLEKYIGEAIVNFRSQWSLKDQEVIQISLLEKGSQVKVSSKRKKGGDEILSSAPKKKFKDVFENQEFINKLIHFKEIFTKSLIGQDELAEKISQAILAHKSFTNNKKPLSFFLLGSTGTGKTETARVIAKIFHGSEERAVIIPLSNITYTGQMNDIFGSPKGFAGSDRESLFERALRNNPTGGVIVFDEASNAGGYDKHLKETIMKHFYNLTDEGKWTSNVTDQTYNLSKYTFIFTGNDGEKIFQGVSHEDLRLAIWEEAKETEQLRKLLLEAGVPEAFLSRMSLIALYKPLLTSEVNVIVEKFLEPIKKETEKWGGKINYSKEFLNSFSEVFFTQGQGGRSLKNVVDQQIKSLITQARFRLTQENKQNDSITITLSLEDNLPKTFYVEGKDFKRKVSFTAEVSSKNTKLFQETLDVTQNATKKILLGKKEAKIVAYHEAGHAVLNDPHITGQKLVYLTIIPGGDVAGYARYEEENSSIPKLNLDREALVILVAQLLAGGISQKRAGYPYDTGMSNDYEKAQKVTKKFYESGAAGNSSWRKKKNFKNFRSEIFQEAEEVANKILDEKKETVEAFTQALLKEGALNEEKINNIINGVGGGVCNKIF